MVKYTVMTSIRQDLTFLLIVVLQWTSSTLFFKLSHGYTLQGDRALKSSLLSALRSKNGLELELLEVEEKIEEVDKERVTIDQEMERVNVHLKEIQDNFDATKINIYAPHDVDVGLFTAKVEGQITHLEETRRCREVKLCDLSLKAEVAREEAAAMLHETEELRSRAFNLDRIEEKEDEESTALALQLKATMAKVSMISRMLFHVLSVVHFIVYSVYIFKIVD